MWQTNYYNFPTFFLIIPRLVNVAESEFESEFSTLVTNYVLLRLSRLVIIFLIKFQMNPLDDAALSTVGSLREPGASLSVSGGLVGSSCWGVMVRGGTGQQRNGRIRNTRLQDSWIKRDGQLRKRRPTPKETISERDGGLLAQSLSLRHWPLDVVWRLS